MPTATTYGLSPWLSGWTGSIQAKIGGDTLVFTPIDPTSPARVVEGFIADARMAWPAVTWSWAFDASGAVTLTADTAFQLLGAGNTPDRLGLTVPSSTLTTHTGTATVGLWAVWMVYGHDYRRQQERAAFTYGGCSLIHTPANNPRQPEVSGLCTAAQSVAWAEAWDGMEFPGKLDVVQDGETLTTYRAASWRSANRGHLGHHEVTVEVIR